MSWKNLVPDWMKANPGGQDAAADPGLLQAAEAPVMPVPLPTIIVGGGATVHDQGRTDAIVEALVAAVPSLQDLFTEADKIKDAVSDVPTRFSVVMRLKGISPQGAAEIVAGLRKALAGVQQTGETELQTEKTNKIDGPNGQIARNQERRAALAQEIETLDRQTGELRQSVETAVQEIAREAGLFQASLTQAQAWIGKVAEQLGIKN